MTLRLLGEGPGDEVIVPSYTYTASASVVCHVGAKPVIVDIQKDSFEMDYEKVEELINENTKAIIPVDIGGIMCDYDRIFNLVESKKHLFNPANDIQKAFGRIVVVADAAHSYGASRKGKMSGEVADFSCFSFHAVKNFTTAEGGAVTWKEIDGINSDDIYKQYQLLSLHGQTVDALHKNQIGAWKYDIIAPYYKCNMTDIMGAIGVAQMERYPSMLSRREEMIKKYNEAFKDLPIKVLDHYGEDHKSSGHLYITRIDSIDEVKRDEIIVEMAKRGIATNVHYIPLPMFTAYKNLGFNIKDYPNAYDFYKNEITLPLYTKLTDEDLDYIVDNYIEVVKECL